MKVFEQEFKIRVSKLILIALCILLIVSIIVYFLINDPGTMWGAIFFMFLAISGYRQIQYGEYLISESFDGALLKAFLVYIAFTNMRAKASVAELDVKGLLHRTLLLFEHDK